MEGGGFVLRRRAAEVNSRGGVDWDVLGKDGGRSIFAAEVAEGVRAEQARGGVVAKRMGLPMTTSLPFLMGNHSRNGREKRRKNGGIFEAGQGRSPVVVCRKVSN